MDRTDRFVAAEGRDDPLDLSPVAKPREIAVVAAALGPRRRLEARVVAIAVDEIRSVRKRQTAMDEYAFHGRGFTLAAISRLPTSKVNEALTMFDLASALRLWHGPLMPSTARAGGCFLTICILAGLPLGLAIGNPMKGVLIGTGAGIALAVLTWLIDRTRRR